MSSDVAARKAAEAGEEPAGPLGSGAAAGGTPRAGEEGVDPGSAGGRKRETRDAVEDRRAGDGSGVSRTAAAPPAEGERGTVPFPFRDRETPTVFEKSRPGRRGVSVPAADVPERPLEELVPAALLRERPGRLPELPEHEVVRHYTELSLKNHHVDRGFYPLGSCTMKHNPKVNEQMARLPGFAGLHPFRPEETVQGALRLMWELSEMLREIAGMDAVSLQPAAGAQGEMAGVLLMRAYHRANGDTGRRKVLIPDSAHGTNPATVALAGFEVVELPSDDAGRIDLDALRGAVGEDTAGLMLTNPNTLGVFEDQVEEISRAVHEAGGLMYMDGANMNALMGVVRPGDMGYDIIHFNLHKTFSSPHGGGGPGAGPVAVVERLEPFLPVPRLARDGERFTLEWDRPRSIGKLHGFYGNFGVMVRAYTYIRMLGAAGVRETADAAVLNNAYLSARLADVYPLPYGRGLHESVFSGARLKREHGVKTLDIAKRLLDFGFHAPTVYFPLNVAEALMTEPTETETREELDRYAEAMLAIAREAAEEPDRVKTAPHTTPVRRMDEGRAGRRLDIRWSFPED